MQLFTVPYTRNRYSVLENGQVFDQDGSLLESKMIDDHLQVELDWFDGKRYYYQAIVIQAAVVTFGAFPYHLYNELYPCYINGDRQDVSIHNLGYRFKSGKLEVLEWPGFYHVPYFPGTAINIEAELIRIRDGKQYRWYVSKGNEERNRLGGYHQTSVNLPGCRKVTMMAHRAICMVFNGYPDNSSKLTVNHKDCDPTNNRPDNLEWASYSENNLHASQNGRRVKRARAVLVKNLKTGVVDRYPNISHASRGIGKPHTGLIRHRLDNPANLHKVYPDFLQIKYDDGEPFPDINVDNAPKTFIENIVARNVFTGELIIFETVRKAADLLGIEYRVIVSHIRESRQTPVCGYNFQLMENMRPWPNHTERHLEIYRKYPKHPRNGVIVINPETSEETFYTSAADYAKTIGASTAHVCTAISNRRLYRGKVLKSFDLNDELGHPTEQSVENKPFN